MYTDHRLDQASPETIVVMRVDKSYHWELGCYDATKNATGFDPNQHAAEVAMWMDPFSESKIQRVNGMIALGAKASRAEPGSSLFDEAGRMKRNGRTTSGNRPSSATRRRRRQAEPVLIREAPVAPQPVMEIFRIATAIQPTVEEFQVTAEWQGKPGGAILVMDDVGDRLVLPEDHDYEWAMSLLKPLPLIEHTAPLDKEELDAFAARWERVNAAAAQREAATRDADQTFTLPALPDIPPVAEVPSRPKLGSARGTAKVRRSLTEPTEQFKL